MATATVESHQALEDVLRLPCLQKVIPLWSQLSMAQASKACNESLASELERKLIDFTHISIADRDAVVGPIDLHKELPVLPDRVCKEECLIKAPDVLGRLQDSAVQPPLYTSIPTIRRISKVLDLLAGGLLEDIWEKKLPVVVAGGAVVRAMEDDMQQYSWDYGDIDMWFLTDNPLEAARSVIDSMRESRLGLVVVDNDHQLSDPEYMASNLPVAKVAVIRSNGRQSLREIVVKFDMILLPFSDIFTVLQRFDLPCCKFAYDGARVLTTFSGLEAFRTHSYSLSPEDLRHIDPQRCVPRMNKYLLRGYSLRLLDIPEAKACHDSWRTSSQRKYVSGGDGGLLPPLVHLFNRWRMQTPLNYSLRQLGKDYSTAWLTLSFPPAPRST